LCSPYNCSGLTDQKVVNIAGLLTPPFLLIAKAKALSKYASHTPSFPSLTSATALICSRDAPHHSLCSTWVKTYISSNLSSLERSLLVLARIMVVTAETCIKVLYRGGKGSMGRRASSGFGLACGDISSDSITLDFDR
jgi:hypothetical protein